MLDHQIEQVKDLEAALARFREQSFVFDECLDLLTTLRDDLEQRALFEQTGYQREWLEDLVHQRRVLEEMSSVLLDWGTIQESRAGREA